MADNTIDKLIIDVEARTDEADTALRNIEKTLSRISEVTKKVKGVGEVLPKGTTERIKEVSSSIESLNNKTVNIKIKADTKELDTGVKKVTEFAENLNKGIGKDGINIDVDTKVSTDGMESVKAVADTTKALKENVEDVSDSLEKTSSTVGELKKKSTALTVLNKILKAIGRAALFVTKAVGSAFKALGKFSANVGKKLISTVFSPFTMLGRTMKNLIGKVKGFGRAMSRVILFRSIRKMLQVVSESFTTGIENLYQWSKIANGTFSQSMDSIATSMQYFKNSVAAAVAPLLNSFAPVLDAIVDKLVTIINGINQVFAKLSGASTWTKATKVFKEWAYEADDATTNVKNLKESLMGFDEINKLTSDSKNLVDYSSMFTTEEVPVDISWGDFLSKINDNIGGRFADTINGWFDNVDWEGIGTKLSDKLNNIVSVFKGFVDNINTFKIGGDLGSFVEKFIEGVKWDTIGEVIGTAFTRIWEGIDGFIQALNGSKIGTAISKIMNGFITKVDWNSIGQTIADAWNLIKDALKALIEKLDLTKLGNGLGKIVTSFVTKVNWKDSGKTIGEAFKNILGGLGSLFEELKNADIGTKMAEFIDGFADANVLSKAGEVAGKICSTIVDAFKNFFVTLNTVDEKTGKTTWQKLASDFAQGFNNLLNSIKPADLAIGISNALIGAFDFITTSLSNIDWNKAGESVADFINNLDISGGITGLINSICSAINAAITFGASLLTHVDWGKLVAGIFTGIQNALSNPNNAFVLTIAVGTLAIASIGKILLKNAAQQVLNKLTGTANTTTTIQCQCNCSCGGSSLQPQGVLVKGFARSAITALGGAALGYGVSTLAGNTSLSPGTSTTTAPTVVNTSLGVDTSGVESGVGQATTYITNNYSNVTHKTKLATDNAQVSTGVSSANNTITSSYTGKSYSTSLTANATEAISAVNKTVSDINKLYDEITHTTPLKTNDSPVTSGVQTTNSYIADNYDKKSHTTTLDVKSEITEPVRNTIGSVIPSLQWISSNPNVSTTVNAKTTTTSTVKGWSDSKVDTISWLKGISDGSSTDKGTVSITAKASTQNNTVGWMDSSRDPIAWIEGIVNGGLNTLGNIALMVGCDLFGGSSTPKSQLWHTIFDNGGVLNKICEAGWNAISFVGNVLSFTPVVAAAEVDKSGGAVSQGLLDIVNGVKTTIEGKLNVTTQSTTGIGPVEPILTAIANYGGKTSTASLTASASGKIGSNAENDGKKLYNWIYDVGSAIRSFPTGNKSSTVTTSHSGKESSFFNDIKDAISGINSKTATVKAKYDNTSTNIKTFNDVSGAISKIYSKTATVKAKYDSRGSTSLKDFGNVGGAISNIKSKTAKVKATLSGSSVDTITKVGNAIKQIQSKTTTVTIEPKMSKVYLDFACSQGNLIGAASTVPFTTLRSSAKKSDSQYYYFAKGGSIGKATNAIIGEAGREVVLPLERNQGRWMDMLSSNIVSRMDNNAISSNNSDVSDAVAEGVYRGFVRASENTDGNLTVYLDGKAVAQSTLKQFQSMARQGAYPLASLV